MTDDLDMTPCAWCRHPAHVHELGFGECLAPSVWPQCTCIQMTRPRETR